MQRLTAATGHAQDAARSRESPFSNELHAQLVAPQFDIEKWRSTDGGLLQLARLFVCFQHVGDRGQDRSTIEGLGDDPDIPPFGVNLIGVQLPGYKHKRDAAPLQLPGHRQTGFPVEADMPVLSVADGPPRLRAHQIHDISAVADNQFVVLAGCRSSSRTCVFRRRQAPVQDSAQLGNG
jgi:hypothetical protein